MLKAQLVQLDEIKRDREILEGEIKAVTFDMTTKFLTALAQDGAINEEALSTGELDTRYGAYTQRVQQNLRSQEDILAQVQVQAQNAGSTYTVKANMMHISVHFISLGVCLVVFSLHLCLLAMH